MSKCYPAKIIWRSFSLIKTKSPSWDVHDLAFLSFGAWFSFQLAVCYRIQLQRKRSVSQEAHLFSNSFSANLASMAALKASSQNFQGKLVFQDSLFLSEFCTPFSTLQLFSFVFISIIMIIISFIAFVLHYWLRYGFWWWTSKMSISNMPNCYFVDGWKRWLLCIRRCELNAKLSGDFIK